MRQAEWIDLNAQLGCLMRDGEARELGQSLAASLSGFSEFIDLMDRTIDGSGLDIGGES